MLNSAALLLLTHLATPSGAAAPFQTVALDGFGYVEAVRMLAPAGMTSKTYPSSTTRRVIRWTGEDGGLASTIDAVLPGLYAEDKTEAEKAVRDQARKLHDEFSRNGGQTQRISRGGFEVRLTVGYDFVGNFRAVESSESPVVYSRAITAKADDAPRAESMLTGQSMWAGGDRVSVYGGDFPGGWTLSFAGGTLPIPRPKDSEMLEGKTGSMHVTTYSGPDARWHYEDHFKRTEEGPAVWAARPHPRAESIGPDAKVTESGVVSVGARKLVRVKGIAGRGEFREEWVAWYDRDDLGDMTSILAVRKLAKPWPRTLPLNPDEPATPVTEEAWIEPKTTKARTVTIKPGASVSLTIFGRPSKGEFGISYLFNPPYEQTALLYEKGAEDVFATYDPRKGWIPSIFKDKDSIMDMALCERNGSTWALVRTLVEDPKDGRAHIRRFELLRTVQAEVPFLLYLQGLESESFRRNFREVVTSLKGADGVAPFAEHPEAGGTVKWYLPYHQLTFTLKIQAPVAAAAIGTELILLGGWTLEDGKTRVMFSARPKSGLIDPMQNRFGEAVKWTRKGRPKNSKIKAFGMDAQVEENNWEKEDGTPTILTSVSHREGAAVHFSRPKGTPDTAWKAFVEKNR